MNDSAASEREYSIQVSAVADATGVGYAGKVVVQALPVIRELLREEVLFRGQPWSCPRDALEAAYARGLRFAHFELCRSLADRWPGDEGERSPADDNEMEAFRLASNYEVHAPPGGAAVAAHEAASVPAGPLPWPASTPQPVDAQREGNERHMPKRFGRLHYLHPY